LDDAESPYVAPMARIEGAPENRGSLVAGLFLGWAALVAGCLLAVLWGMFVIMALAVESRLVAIVAPFGLLVVPLVPALAARWFWRRHRYDTANGILMAVVTTAVVAGLVVAYFWHQ
jgi:hypothetical protein